jgi:Uma2 family endonuclease
MFERFGVQEYWMVDPVAETVDVRELRGGRYELIATAGRGARLQSNVLAGFGCAVDTLFPWDK